jgi:flagellar FliL protein
VAEETAKEEQQAAEAESDAVKKKKGEETGGGGGPNQKLLFMLLLMNTVVLVALAAIVWMGYSKRQDQVSLGDIAASKEAPKEAEASEGHGGGHGGEKKGKEGEDAGAENFIKESFTVNLADPKGSHYAKVDVEIEVGDDFVKEEVNKLRPKIRDFILVVLSSKTYEQIESVDGRDFLREEIRNKINGYLSRGQVKNVFFTQFIIQ